MKKYCRIIFIIFILTIVCNGVHPPKSGSGGTPPADIEINISANVSDVYRGEAIQITYCIKCTDIEKATDIKGIINIPEYFIDMNVISEPHSFKRVSTNNPYLIKFKDGSLHKNECVYYIYEAYVLEDAPIGEHPLNDTIDENDWDWEIHKGKLTINDNPNLYIKNNIPKIMSSNVTIISEPLNHLDGNTLLFNFKGDYKPIKVRFDVVAEDKDDQNLTYTWIVEQINRTYKFDNASQTKELDNLSSGIYSFKVKVNDTNLSESGVVNATIQYRNMDYRSFTITAVNFNTTFIVLTNILAFIVVAILVKFKPWLSNILLNTRIIICAIGAGWTLYFAMYYLSNGIFLGRNNLFAYTTSLSFFEILIYMTVFVVIAHFTEICFSHVELLTSRLWIVNSISMAIFLLFLAIMVPLVEPHLGPFTNIEGHLQWYYSSMAQVFASILAIVAVFSTALPNKNIVSIDDRKKEVEYPQPKILKCFIILYGLLLLLSFLGLSSGVHVEFHPFIYLNLMTLPNLISISLFELTLLLIPSAVSCLYALIIITAYTGTVNIKSNPPKANIYLEYGGEEYDTQLITPNKLMIHNGHHGIVLRKGDYKSKDKIDVIAGTERTYEYTLSLRK